MITQVFIGTLIDLLNAIVGWLPNVTTLPTILSFDIDTALITGVGELRTFFTTFWPFMYVFEGFMVLLTYYGIKMLLRLLLGHRAPQ